VNGTIRSRSIRGSFTPSHGDAGISRSPTAARMIVANHRNVLTVVAGARSPDSSATQARTSVVRISPILR
jgi:hypothetical protein